MEATVLSSGGMTKRLDRLEAAGLVQRSRNPSDRRGVEVKLTAAGRRSVDRAIEAHLDRNEYLARRQEIQTQLAELAPEPFPDLDEAEQVLSDFSVFWRNQSDPDEKQQMLQLVFERVRLDEGRVVAVRPKHAFAPFFQKRARKSAAKKARCQKRGQRGSNPRPPA
jgi:DNA-binding MarR family transcriptional regulator